MSSSARAKSAERDFENAAASYQATCVTKRAKIELSYSRGELRSWDDLKDHIEESLLHTQRGQPLTLLNLKSFLNMWVHTARDRFKIAENKRKVEAAAVSTRFVAADDVGITQVGRFILRPRQRKCLNNGIAALRSGATSAIVVPLEGGEGKSVIGWGFINYWIANNYFNHPTASLPFQLNLALFATAAGVKIDMENRGVACQVPNLNRSTVVVSHTEWHTKVWDPFFREEIEVLPNGAQRTRLKYIMPPPPIMVIDESDAYKKPSSLKSKRLLAIIEAGIEKGSVVIFMSATPWVTINDTWLFCIATGRKWNGERITFDNFPAVARSIAASVGADPSKPSEKAIEAFRKQFNDCFIVPPRDPRKVKAHNKTLLVRFKNAEDKAYYDRTIERYQEELERIGKGDTDVNKLTAFLKLRQSEEWLKTSYFVDLMMESHAKGFAPVCGVSFTASCNEIVRQLVERGVPRNKISVIQGGDIIITKQKIISLVGEDFFNNAASYILRYQDPERFGPPLTPKERSGCKMYLKWIKERLRNEEDEKEQTTRIAQLRQLRLFKQSRDERFREKEKFQNGETEYMVFTLPSGGRGIDMDHQFPNVRPREGFFTICYYAEEFMQALYRLMRVATLTDVNQSMVFFEGTIVADHVAPRLDRKIKSVRAGILGNEDFAEETIDLLARPVERHVTQADLRDGSDTDDDIVEGFDADKVIEEQQELFSDED